MKHRQRVQALGVAVTAALVLAACAPFGTDDADSPDSDEVVELVYWSWAPQIESIVEIFNDTHPNIHVTVDTAAGFNEFNAKLLAAYKAGNSPDVNNTSYGNLPLLITNGVVADITDVMGPLKDDFHPVGWDMVSFDDTVYGVPQSTTPNLLLYREDLFDQYGIEPPTTWEEYADAARAVHAADPSVYLGNWDFAGGFSFWTALAQQNGVDQWAVDGDEWTVGIADEKAIELAEFWGQLAEEGVISTYKFGSPELNAMIASGKVLSSYDSVWGPVTLEGIAPDTQGLWNVAPGPQWDTKNPVSGVLGGSATVVSSITEHPEEARELALWLNASDDALRAYIQKVSIFPAKLSAREFPELNTPPALMPNVPDFYDVVADVDENAAAVTWGPNSATAGAAFGSAFGKALSSPSPDAFVAALRETAQAVADDMQTSGYKVTLVE